MKPVAIGAALLIVGVCCCRRSQAGGTIVRRSYGAASVVDRAGRAAAGFGRAGNALAATIGWTSFVSVFLFWHWPVAFQWAATHAATQLLELASILGAAIRSGASRWEPTFLMMARARCM